MESIQNLKRRLKGVQNIGQITKAMEFVAATKMRRSQELALSSRHYALTALRFLGILSELESVKLPEILDKRKIEKTAFVLVSSDKGLAGSFNGAIIREFEKFISMGGAKFNDEKNLFIAVGEKSRSYLERKGVRILKSFIRVGDFTTTEETKPLSDFLIDGYIGKKWDQVLIFSTHFMTALYQKPLRRQIFPVDFENLKETAKEIIPQAGRFAELAKEVPSFFPRGVSKEYLIEPSPEIVLDSLGKHLIEMQLYHLILEANASEHAARRVAMKNASDNAEELASDLTIFYNKSRQAAITREITEITAGVEALRA